MVEIVWWWKVSIHAFVPVEASLMGRPVQVSCFIQCAIMYNIVEPVSNTTSFT